MAFGPLAAASGTAPPVGALRPASTACKLAAALLTTALLALAALGGRLGPFSSALSSTKQVGATSFEKQIGGVSFLGRPFNDLHEYWADPNSPFEIKGECGRVSCTVVGERVLSSFDSGFTSL